MSERADDTAADSIDHCGNPLSSESQPLFETAFRLHQAPLIHYLRRRVGSDADACDIAQEAYLRLLRYRNNQDLNSLKALLFRIAANILGMRARTARTQHWADHEPLDEDLPLPANDPSHEQRLLDEQRLDQLMQAVKRMPAKCQQVFILSRFHDMSYPEIAARLSISTKMVEKHIAKAITICRAEVGDELP